MKPSKMQETKATILFSAKLSRHEAGEKRGAGAVVILPKNASAKVPSGGMTMVEGSINAFPFRGAIEAEGKGSHRLRVTEAIQEAAGAEIGETVTVEITRVGEEAEIRVPMELSKALGAVPPAQAAWADITPMARRDWILWISTAKQPETRRRRIETACDMLANGKRRVCCFPGLNWLTREHVTPEETWLQLPNAKNRLSTKTTK